VRRICRRICRARFYRESVILLYILFNASTPRTDWWLLPSTSQSLQPTKWFHLFPLHVTSIETPDNCGMLGAIAVIASDAVLYLFFSAAPIGETRKDWVEGKKIRIWTRVCPTLVNIEDWNFLDVSNTITVRHVAIAWVYDDDYLVIIYISWRTRRDLTLSSSEWFAVQRRLSAAR